MPPTGKGPTTPTSLHNGLGEALRGDGLPLLGEGLELAERGRMPGIDRAGDDRDDPRRPRLVSLHRPLDLDVPAVARGEEVGADQEQDDARLLEVRADGPVPLGAR